MTVLDRPRRHAHQAAAAPSKFSGTPALLRLCLRRDRVVLPLWVVLLSVPVGAVYVGSIAAVYPTAADRAVFAATIMASPAQRALYGDVYGDSLGATGIWKAGMFHVLIAVAVILTMVRHTRADEESGRTELIGSTAVGRYAGLTAALLLTGGASMLTGLIGTAGLLPVGVPAAGSVAFGLALACTGLVFTAVAAVAVQLSSSARVARGIAFAVLATAFTLRAVGDASSRAQFLSWLSPLGWSLQVRPYAGDRFWVLLLPVAFTTALIAVAYPLLARRDVGAGLLPERPGAPRAAASLRGVMTLAWRLHRGTIALWTVGLMLYGLLVGSVVDGVGGEMGGSQSARDVVVRLGGTDHLQQAFITIAFGMLAMVASALAVSVTQRLHQEESSQRAETLLASAVSRTRWLASHLVVAIVVTAAAMTVAGLAAGLTYGAAAGDVAGKLGIVLATAAVEMPAVWLLAAVTVALFGLLPRFTPAAWGVLVAFIAVYLLGSLANAPQWLLDLEPFAHVPHVGIGAVELPTAAVVAARNRRRVDRFGGHGLSPPRPDVMKLVVQYVVLFAVSVAFFGAGPVPARGNVPLSAGVGVPRGVRHDHVVPEPLSRGEVSGRAAAPDEGWSDRGDPPGATRRHGRHHRRGGAAVGGQRARSPLRVVVGARARGDRRCRARRRGAARRSVRHRSERLCRSHDHGRSRPAAGVHRSLRRGPPPDVPRLPRSR